MEAAGAMLEAHWQQPMLMGDRVLFMQYSHEPKHSATGPPVGRDWVCEMCQGINFFRCNVLDNVDLQHHAVWALLGCDSLRHECSRQGSAAGKGCALQCLRPAGTCEADTGCHSAARPSLCSCYTPGC